MDISTRTIEPETRSCAEMQMSADVCIDTITPIQPKKSRTYEKTGLGESIASANAYAQASPIEPQQIRKYNQKRIKHYGSYLAIVYAACPELYVGHAR